MAKNEEKKPAGAEQALPTAEQQGQQAEADAATIRALHDMIMIVGDQIEKLTNRVADLERKLSALGEPITAELAVAAESQTNFDPAWLEGLVFKGSKEVDPEGGQNGRKVKRFQAFERQATVDDVLSYRLAGDTVAIVLADGTKHQVER